MNRSAAFVACWLMLFATSSVAQNVQEFATLRDLEQATSRYYEKPVDVAKLLTAWERLGTPGTNSMMGFLTGVFVKYPNQIGVIMKTPLDRKTTQVIVIRALRLAQKISEAKKAAQDWGWPPEEVERITSVRQLHSVKAQAPHFDVYWGASFATGDPVYVRPIYDYYADAVAQPDIDLGDVVAVVIARHRRDNQPIAELGKKHSREVFVRIAFAATALWSLESNARQHKFVAAALDGYVKEQPNSPAVKGLIDLRKAMAR